MDCNSDKLGIEEAGLVTKRDSQRSLSLVDKAIESVSSLRGELGAIGNRLEATARNISVSIENLTAARSRIKDVDIAEESAELTKHNILMNAGTSVLAQANNIPKMALSLLGGGGG
jgi:flagellin